MIRLARGNLADRRQVEATARLAPLLAGMVFCRVLTSAVQRARETCRLAGPLERAKIQPDLGEWDCGAYEGLS